MELLIGDGDRYAAMPKNIGCIRASLREQWEAISKELGIGGGQA
jgi:hypothetical protein